jgi:hypothetical protein
MGKSEMQKKNLIRIAILASLSLSSAAFAADPATCEANFTGKGGFMSGKQFVSWQEYPKTKQLDLFKKVYAAVLKQGKFQVTTSDKDLGTITATQSVTAGGGKTIPVNIMVESNDSGSKVTANMTVPGGLMASGKEIKKLLCELVAIDMP